MQTISLDDMDRKILRLLQTVPGVTATQIGERIGTSQATCWRRIRRSRDEGPMPDRPVALDRKKTGFNAMVFAQVKLNAQGRSDMASFSRAVQSFPEVLECYVLMGSVDFLLRVVARDVDAYERFFFERLSKLPGVQEITSSMSLSEIKRTTALPL